MDQLYRQIERAAATSAPVLITGESGSGKELVARTIHALSARRDRPFLAVSCGALAPERLEAELWNELERAAGGTLFLEEIGVLSPALQARLLQVLETRTLQRVGAAEPLPTDARIVAASEVDLDEARRRGEFRADLLARLAACALRVPPLRERDGDAELLARHFVDEINARERTRKSLSRRSLEALRSQGWPGNLRELRSAVQRAYVLADLEVELDGAAALARPRVARDAEGALRFGVGTSLADAQREILMATLEHFGGDKRRTARVLGISLKTLYNRLGLYGDTRHVRRRAPLTGTGGHH